MAADKPFKCPVDGCDWKGKTQGGLTLHAKKHENEDPLASLRAGIPGAPRPGGAWNHDKPLEAMPSGIPSIDYAIGIGGVPRGTLIEVFGEPQCGKTFTALAFSTHAIRNGGKAGFMDAERALTETFTRMVGGEQLLDKLEYGQPPDEDPKKGWDGSGEAALEASRRFIRSGEFDVWTIDSVHACTPRTMLGKPIGDPATRAALAQLMSQGCQVLEHEISQTRTLGVFVNHVKAIPAVTFGRDWSKPGGSAFDYYCSVQLHCWTSGTYKSKGGRRIGHKVKVKVHKSKVAAPHATAEYDLYYVDATREDGKEVKAGVDLASCWFSVLDESEVVQTAGGKWYDGNGEHLGSREDILEACADENSSLVLQAKALVYPEQYAGLAKAS